MKNEEMDEKLLEELKADLSSKKEYIYRKEWEVGVITSITFLAWICSFYMTAILQNGLVFIIATFALGIIGVVEIIIFAYYLIVGVFIKQKYEYIASRVGYFPHDIQHEIIRKVESDEEENHRINKQNEINKFNGNINTDIINKILESLGKEYIYIPDKGLERQVVEDAEFEKFDMYYTNDLIEGKFKNCTIKMAEILTDYDATKKNNPENIETYKYIFAGIFAHIELPQKIDTALYIRRRSKIYSNLKEKNIKKISFKDLNIKKGVRKFKRRFNIYLDNSAGIELLKPDVIQILIDFFYKTKINYEITVKNNNIYIRFENINPSMFWMVNENDIHILYRIIEFIQNLTEKLVKE